MRTFVYVLLVSLALIVGCTSLYEDGCVVKDSHAYWTWWGIGGVLLVCGVAFGAYLIGLRVERRSGNPLNLDELPDGSYSVECVRVSGALILVDGWNPSTGERYVFCCALADQTYCPQRGTTFCVAKGRLSWAA